MEWVETTGKSVEEAKEAALDQLGVDGDEAEFEILAEPRAGLFGRVRAEARVRARIKPASPRPKEDRRPRRRGSNGPRRVPSTSARPPAAGSERTEVTMDHEEEVPLEEQGEVARSFLVGLLERLEVQASVETSPVDEDTIEIDVQGEDLGVLIGAKGQTLAALQELARTVVQRKTGARTGWVVVDVAGYRRRRREALERFAHQVADEVLASGKPRALEPMLPADRKVVHDTVNGIAGVSTTSEGEDPNRRVVLTPAGTAEAG